MSDGDRTIAPLEVRRYDGVSLGPTVPDAVAVEEPLAVVVDGRTLQITMRTPGHDEELAAGWCLAEGIVSGREDIRSVERDGDNRVCVELGASRSVDLEKFTRRVVTSSSCGICGTTSIDRVRYGRMPLADGPVVSASVLTSLGDKLRAAQETFSRTGGLHGAGVFDADGELALAREDVGRHNAVDKLLGRLFLDGKLPTPLPVLFVSGRVSFEIAQKALTGGFPILAAVSAPSSLAVELATRTKMTLVGFSRGATFNVYSNPDRIAP